MFLKRGIKIAKSSDGSSCDDSPENMQYGVKIFKKDKSVKKKNLLSMKDMDP